MAKWVPAGRHSLLRPPLCTSSPPPLKETSLITPLLLSYHASVSLSPRLVTGASTVQKKKSYYIFLCDEVIPIQDEINRKLCLLYTRQLRTIPVKKLKIHKVCGIKEMMYANVVQFSCNVYLTRTYLYISICIFIFN